MAALNRRVTANSARRSEFKRGLAEHFRHTPTDAERKLWSLLRNKQLAGLRFRRQQPIGPFVVYFYCSAAKLIIELDGDMHGEDRHAGYDNERTRWLSTHGYRVLRFPNGTVLKSSQVILDGIWNALQVSAIPLPKPPLAV